VRKLLAALVALSLLVPALPAAAAEQVQVSVRTGFDGMVRQGTWIPVEISLANAGPNVSGSVELSVQRRGTTQTSLAGTQSVDYSVPVTVPEHSSKRFSTAVFVPPFFDQILVRLLSGQQVLYRQTFALQRIDATQVFCGVLADDQTAFDSLNALSLGDGSRQPHVVYLDLPDLPTNPQLLSSLDCLIVSDYATRGLNTLQQSALASWVDNGGVLTVGTGPTAGATLAGLPPDMLPARADGTVALRSLTSLAGYFGGSANAGGDPTGPWLMANLKVNDGVAIVSDESQPLVVVGRRGKGAIFMLSLSLTEKPLRGWDGLDHIWNYILSYVPASNAILSAYSRPDFGWGRVPREALIQGSTGTGPEAQRLILGLILFGLLVGPVNFLALSHLRRRELTLLTVPIFAVAGTAAAILYAGAHHQSDVTMNEVSIVRTWDGSGIGEAHSFIGVFALHSQHFGLQIPPNALLSNNSFTFPGQSTRGLPALQVIQSGNAQVQGLDLEPGILTTFALDGHMSEPGRVHASLVLAGDNLNGQVTNDLPSMLRDAVFVAGGSVQSIGNLRPGASHAISVHLGSASPVGFRDMGAILDRLFPGQSSDSSASPVRRDPRYSILAAALNPSQSFGGQVEFSGVGLLGWLDDPVSPVLDSETHQGARQRVLYVTNLPVQASGEVQVIPDQLLDRQQLTSSYSARSDANGITLNAGDVAAFQFRAPVMPGHFTLRSLTFATSADGAVPATLEAYNWRAGTWEEVPFAVGNLMIPGPERYFSETGMIRLRFRYRPVNTSGPSTVTFTRFQLLVGGVGR
jgi:hypothetical protein